ncbi:myb/SANT-like DNA-binding domain-containing protein 3 [Amblyomma americanum]
MTQPSQQPLSQQSQLPLSSLDNNASPQRKAAPRFTVEEKRLLTSVVNEHKRFLECKKTDVASLAKKSEVWKEVAKIFNSHHGVTRRDHLQLKKCWANMKQKWKEEDAKQKRELHKTGGGPAPAAMDPLTEQVGAVAGHMATRIYNEFDSDGANDLPPVHTLPVVRLLQPMIDGGGDTECDFTGGGE